MKKILVMMAVLAALVSCGSLDKTKLADPSIRRAVEPLNLKIGYDVYLMRVDLKRQYHTETRTVVRSTGTGSYTAVETVQVPNAYHYIVVDFGNGIIMDFNGNLCLDLARFYGWTNKTLSIEEKPEGFLASTVSYDRDGQKFKRVVRSLIESKSEVDFSSNPVKINNGVFNDNLELNVTDNRIEFNPNGFLGLGKAVIVQETSNIVSIPGFWSDSRFIRPETNLVTLGGAMTIENKVDHLLVTYSGLFGSKTEFTFLKTEDGCYFYENKSFAGIAVSMLKGQVKVYLNQDKITTYYVIKAE